MALTFPASPSDGDTYLQFGVNYVYNATEDLWKSAGVPDEATILVNSGNTKVAATSSGATVTGDLIATGNVTAYSDERLKSDIETVDNALDLVNSMRGVYYTKDNERGVGVIAQEMEAVVPEVVLQGEEYKSVAYGNLVGVLIEAVKELKAEVEKLKGK